MRRQTIALTCGTSSIWYALYVRSAPLSADEENEKKQTGRISINRFSDNAAAVWHSGTTAVD